MTTSSQGLHPPEKWFLTDSAEKAVYHAIAAQGAGCSLPTPDTLPILHVAWTAMHLLSTAW
jgi:hypothetical protein